MLTHFIPKKTGNATVWNIRCDGAKKGRIVRYRGYKALPIITRPTSKTEREAILFFMETLNGDRSGRFLMESV